MMNDTLRMIIFSCLITVIASITGFILKWFFNQAITILKDIRDEIKQLTSVTKAHEYQLNSLIEENKRAYDKSERHANEIMDLQKQVVSLQDRINK